MMPRVQPTTPDNFSSRVWRVLGFTAITLGGLLLIWLSVGVVLLTFAGLLLAIMLHSLSRVVSQRTHLPHGAALAVVVLVLIGFLGTVTFVAGNSLADQITAFYGQIPRLEKRTLSLAQKYPLVSELLGVNQEHPADPSTQPASTSEPTTDPSRPDISGGVAAMATFIKSAVPSVASHLPSVFGATTDIIVSILVVLVVGIYVAASPRTYIEGIVYLVPTGRRHRARETIVAVVYSLRSWMLGQSISMAAVGLMTGIGLYCCGLDLWLLFAVLAGLFNFIPNFGALFSFVPAALVAWGDDPHKVIWVTLVYVIAQSMEGYLITPMVQRRVTEVPPALLIVSQVLMGTLGGLLAIMLAAPITVATLVSVKMLYVEDTLGDDVATPDDQPQVKAQVRSLESESNACDD